MRTESSIPYYGRVRAELPPRCYVVAQGEQAGRGAVIEWEVGKPLRFDHLAHRPRARLEQRRRGGDLDGFRHRPDFQSEIQPGHLFHVEHHPGARRSPETLRPASLVGSVRVIPVAVFITVTPRRRARRRRKRRLRNPSVAPWCFAPGPSRHAANLPRRTPTLPKPRASSVDPNNSDRIVRLVKDTVYHALVPVVRPESIRPSRGRAPPDRSIGLTATSAIRQSKSRLTAAINHLVASLARRGLTCRSWKGAKCFRRNRLSEANAARGRAARRTSRPRPTLWAEVQTPDRVFAEHTHRERCHSTSA
jgi:hypothetical protein